MKISKETKIGVLAIVAGVLLYFGFNFLKGQDFFSSTIKYYVVYKNIDGLTESNPITLNGLTVGKVKGIEILKDRNNALKVTFDVKRGISLNDSTVALLANNGLLGGKVIMLHIGKGKRELVENDSLRGLIEKGLSEMIQEKATPVLSNIDSTVYSFNKRLKEFETVEANLNKLLINFNNTATTLNLAISENRVALGSMLKNLNSLTNTLNDPVNGIKPLMAKANKFADTVNRMELAKTVNKTNQTIENLNILLAKINSGQGSVGKLMKDDSLYINMNHTAADLDKLFIDLRERPKRYVHFSLFGSKDKTAKQLKEAKKEK